MSEKKTLGEVIRGLTCPLMNPALYEREWCRCEKAADYGVQEYGCVYGRCVIYRCRWCGGITNYSKGFCNFPYTKG
jgi:hypothetical protein